MGVVYWFVTLQWTLAGLFDSCPNQIGVANERYVNYAIERLEHGFRSVSIINESFVLPVSLRASLNLTKKRYC